MPGPRYRLILRRGPTPGQVYPLDQFPFTLGRDPANQLAVDGAGVSRRHAQLSLAGDALVLEDLGSSNGTYVNGVRLTAPRHLQANDQITLGQNVEFVVEGPPARPAATVFEGQAAAPGAHAPAQPVNYAPPATA